MKFSNVLTLSVLAGSFVGSMIMSSSAMASKPEIPASCTAIVSQCEAQKYEPGDHKKNGHGLWVDCVAVVAKGGKIEGVTVSEADAKACGNDMKTARAAAGKGRKK